jgi:hypothetical protein
MTDDTRWAELFLRRQTVMREAPSLTEDPDGHHAAIQEAIRLERAMHDLFAH